MKKDDIRDIFAVVGVLHVISSIIWFVKELVN
jgi:hypothetical protein